MIPVLNTTIILLLCCLYQTIAGVPVTSNVISRNVSDKARARSTRQASQCQDELETLKSYTFSSNSSRLHWLQGNVPFARNCSDWCIKIVSCVAVVYTVTPTDTKCVYSDNKTTHSSVATRGNHVYYRVIFRCPKHYRCSDTPCQNGATCIGSKTSFRGVTCVCADGWISWFCEKRQPCLDHKCQNGATCRYSEKVGTTCLCPAGYEGSYCQRPLNTTTTATATAATAMITTEDNSAGLSVKGKTLVVAGVAAVVAATAVGVGVVATTAAAGTAAATAGTTAMARYVL